MRCHSKLLFSSLWLLTTLAATSVPAATIQWLESRRFHLRSGTNAEWEEFSTNQPFGRRLDIVFTATNNTGEQTLLLWQNDVRHDWRIELNGKRLGMLHLMEAPLHSALLIPPRTLRNGSNTLSILPPRENDDIRVGEFRLVPQSLDSALGECAVDVQVTDIESGKATPCRITVSDTNGSLAALMAPTNQLIAARPGVVYTGDGQAMVHLPAGNYTVTATRGFEFSLDSTNITISAGDRKTIRLQLRREVSTPGLVSCDTHVHTFTHSRHGDATIEERAITLAGEGIELPIATDHDIAVDLHPAAIAMRTRHYFTPIIGDEVTTRVGHFNIFPVKAGARLPDNRETNWTQLIDSFRATPAVQVVILNHPRNIHTGFQPFARTNFNRITGEAHWPFDFRFDAMELINSSAMQSDFMTVFHDWFALLNAGHRIVAVGSSDGHDVSRYIVGQGRTYIECDDTKPDALEVDAACRNLKAGRAYVSMGLLPMMTVNDRFRVGDLVTDSSPTLSVKVKVLGPSWIHCDGVELFVNGISIGSTNFARHQSKNGVAGEVEWKLPKPQHDVFLVAIASGPDRSAPHWPVSKPYQPDSPRWIARVIGATNPIRVDGDGDGRFSSAREYGATILNEISDPSRLVRALANFDEAVAIQTAAVARERGLDIASPKFERALSAAPVARQAFRKVVEE